MLRERPRARRLDSHPPVLEDRYGCSPYVEVQSSGSWWRNCGVA
jgi:hypothetical protein